MHYINTWFKMKGNSVPNGPTRPGNFAEYFIKSSQFISVKLVIVLSFSYHSTKSCALDAY